jgi:hypothetical protein
MTPPERRLKTQPVLTTRESSMAQFNTILTATLLASGALGATVATPALADDRMRFDDRGGAGDGNAESNAPAHDHTPPLLFGSPLEIGGYASLDVLYARMFGEDGALVGLQGALLLDHRLSLGIAGYGWTNSQPGPYDAFGNERSFETGYGGATIHYSIYMDNLPVYFTVGALVGGGAIGLMRKDADDYDFDSDNADNDVFAIVQPDVSLHANLTPWLRLGVTAGYRFTSGVDHYGYDNDDVNGFMVGGQVQVGRF